MGVYIKGMEMPKETPVLFCVHPDGKVFADLEGEWREYKAVPVQAHGRLIDADELHPVLRKRAKEFSSSEYGEGVKCGLADAREYIKIAPTIIPAEPSEEQREYEAQVEAAQYCEMYDPSYDPETGAL